MAAKSNVTRFNRRRTNNGRNRIRAHTRRRTKQTTKKAVVRIEKQWRTPRRTPRAQTESVVIKSRYPRIQYYRTERDTNARKPIRYGGHTAQENKINQRLRSDTPDDIRRTHVTVCRVFRRRRTFKVLYIFYFFLENKSKHKNKRKNILLLIHQNTTLRENGPVVSAARVI